MDRILVWILIGLFMIMVVIAGWTILAQRKLAKYLPFLMVVWFMATPVLAQENDSIELADAKPMIFPEPLKTAAFTAGDLIEDLLWHAGITAFLKNDTLNLTNSSGLYYA